MSLISEALRKARQEAAEREANEARAAGGGPGAPRARGGRFGAGLILGALIAVAAAMIGAGGVWWWSTSRASGPEKAGTALEAVDAESVTGGDIATREAADSEAASLAEDRDSLVAPTPGLAEGGEGIPEGPERGLEGAEDHREILEPEGAGDSAVPEDRGVESEATSSGREREFIVSADLGYAELTLDYIAFREHDPYAQINGLEVHVGAVVEGFVVLEVTRQSVRLEDDRGELLLRVR